MGAKSRWNHPRKKTRCNRTAAVHFEPTITPFVSDDLGLESNHQFLHSSHFERTSRPTVSAICTDEKFARQRLLLAFFANHHINTRVRWLGVKRNTIQPQGGSCLHPLLDNKLIEPFSAHNIRSQGPFSTHGHQGSARSVNKGPINFLEDGVVSLNSVHG